MAVAGLAGVVVAVAVGSLSLVVGGAKGVVAVKVEAAPMAPPQIRRPPLAEAVVRSAGRPCAAVDVAMNGYAAVTKGTNTPRP